MSTDTRRIDVDLRDDLDQEVPPDIPTEASLEVAYGEGSRRTVTIEHGQDEWTLEFEDGQCVDRDPATRPLPQWINDALDLVSGELR
ncbi:hypothetical protein [Natronobacterium gregoryi]|uniref:Uncharacterized protein n=2 Tax=Natronobacterium gregoryi TaxID=44930 RepID=L0AGY5_NATGS|nr:hypothetical protein [Natronobacterium gregoryi]AFZ73071.1 hypothetical protein Natgr_1886 [Natronobacterium gregoryi SP2]ELY70828.1 hypothetical protein C490_06042 [Natronobacterium gregoryi SP2]PLK20408.1 hypothetical protein CYV19_09785 [Natronobacterium gregoryi SP2]SFI61958.1 hypothetical protein SAMN05443661_102195 [Natronobacterium gregoryi]